MRRGFQRMPILRLSIYSGSRLFAKKEVKKWLSQLWRHSPLNRTTTGKKGEIK